MISGDEEVNEVIAQQLADPCVTDHHAAIVAELKRLSAVAKANNDDTTGIALDNAISGTRGKASLSAFVTVNEQRIAELEPHTNLKAVNQ